MHCLYEEILCHMRACRQTKGHIADTECTVQPEAFMYLADSTQGLHCLILLRRDSKGQTVDDNILTLDTIFLRLCDDTLCNSNALRRRLRQPPLIHRQTKNRRTVVLCERKNSIHTLTLAANGVDDDTPVRHAQCSFDDTGICRVNLQRQVNHALHRLDNVGDDLLLIYPLCANIDIEHLCTCFLLGDCELFDIPVILLKKRLLQAFFAGRIDALTDNIDVAVFRNIPR